jgi:hypothetical protein
VLDFGIAKLRDDTRGTQQAMTQAGDMLGTPQYMAPEQIKGETIDGRTDVYALGCMIYEMVTGRMPFEGATIMALLSKHLIEAPVPPSQRRPDLGLSPAIDQLVLAAMAKEPGQRPPTMEQYGEMIAVLAQTLPADPNRSAPMSVQRAVVPVVTPAAPSSFAAPPVAPAPTPAPAAWTPPPIPPTVRAAPPAKKSRTPLYVVLGVLVLGGGGLAAYLATRPSPAPAASPAASPGSNTPAPAPAPTPAPAPPAPDPWNGSATTPPTAPDPWATSSGAKPAPQHEVNVGTAATPIPDGAKLIVPSTWRAFTAAPGTIGYVDPATGIFVGMGPLGAGTNDPKKLAQQWVTSTGAQLQGLDKVYSAGAQRDAAGFAATVNGVPVVQVIVMFPTKHYRVGVIYQAPAAMLDQPGFEDTMKSFFADSVQLP